MALSWVPERRGLIYCSPACGFGCTITAHDRAVLRSNEVAAMLGEGWRAVVGENLGWYWSVVAGDDSYHSGAIRVHENKSYVDGTPTGTWTVVLDNFSATASTPQEAIADVKAALAEKIAKLTAKLNSIPSTACPCSPGDECSCAYDCDCRERFEHVWHDDGAAQDDGYRNTGKAL